MSQLMPIRSPTAHPAQVPGNVTPMQNSPMKSAGPTLSSDTPPGDSTALSPSRASEDLQKVKARIGEVIRGNDEAITLTLACILARGHVLIEDVPGVGKTTLARTVAKVLGCDFSRIQFTADLLPSDVIGVQILDPKTGELRFRKGPIFSHLVLADEINRASPKTQSALLEAMSDRQVSVDESSHRLEGPFSVLATQNPIEHHGTYPLPESQLDRFMVILSLGYPSHDDEKSLLQNHRGAEASIGVLEPLLNPAHIISYAEAVENVEINDAVADYLLRLVQETRIHSAIHLGCSPRGGLAWAQLARALAYMDGRDFVLPDDVKRTAPFVLTHRIALKGAADGLLARRETQGIIEDILSQTQAPR